MTNLRDLLANAVPELPAPEDRVAEVGARVRGRRRSASALAAVTIAVAVGAAVAVPNLIDTTNVLPGVSDTQVTVGGDGCPALGTFHGPSDKDAPGLLVPAGAADVALCEIPSQLPGPPPEAPPPLRVLTAGVDEVVKVLNGLPGTKRYKELIREREIAEGRPDPGPLEQMGCTAVGHPYDISLRLRYTDREPVFVLLDRNCGSARVGDVTRYWFPTSPLTTFFAKYRDQLAATTDPASVATPACAQTMTADHILRDRYPSGPVDGIRLNREGTNVVLPNELVAAAVCTYSIDARGATLTAHKEHRGELTRLRDTINRQFEMVGSDGPRQAMVECGNPAMPLPQRMVTVTVADATGSASEFWLYRSPCSSAIRAGYAGLEPLGEFVSELDALLR
jgi:hypothetical protein